MMRLSHRQLLSSFIATSLDGDKTIRWGPLYPLFYIKPNGQKFLNYVQATRRIPSIHNSSNIRLF